ncbi:MAG: ATP-binding cassette domain-containing protein [Candidatus Bathyarchaeota archaeon]|nr:ATP-binding cassette domain-containing protein [Candidatus Bathyarchaeum tardum]WGM88855.1 MAG: ATP-binding cassette domain-containing protein [Candidatus Bathyarchaeum tardum]WNZ28903.1 MAG: ATP-binding cassette domain-containing protein [Candidatus Bathyarchaeota archaeon]
MNDIIVTENLTKNYGKVKAVRDLNLSIHSGEVFGFLGPNGAGKTTTIRMLTTLTKPTSGRAIVNGFDVVAQSNKVKQEFGIAQQHMSLDRDLNVMENMELHARLHHIRGAERKQRIEELLEFVGLTEYADRMVMTLSGGLKKRAMIVRALIHRPKILFLDEPTVGLDAQTRRKIWELIRKLNRDGTSIFLTTHYIEEAEALCNRVGVLHQGKLVTVGKPLELRKKLGLFAVETLDADLGAQYNYFPDETAAKNYVQMLPQNLKTIIIRESNLEDVFVELTGQKVIEG